MRTFRALVLAATSVTLAGCINSATLIKVNTNGSGTVEQTTLVNTGAMKAMMPGMQPPGQAGGTQINEADLKRAAERMGKGVRLVSATPSKEGTFEGVKAVFAFDDINQVQVSQDPNMSGSSDGMFGAPPQAPENPVTFKLVKNGATSTLTVEFKDKPTPAPASDAPAGGPNMADPQVMNMVKTMFDGFKINIDLEVAGSIVKTNAEYVNGSRITLMAMDMAALFADQAKLQALQGKVRPGAPLSEVKPYLKDIQGIKIDGPVVNVEFK
ncbi:MAG: hypothetical protein IT178_12420 [Acidobacteria bacterium]|nr:hypothetical protein [Acidobacteriota bacterium]